MKKYLLGLAEKTTTNNIYIRKCIELMSDETWKTQYKKWKELKPYQIKLIDDGPKSQSQAWLLNSMWCEWMDLKKMNVSDLTKKDNFSSSDPWEV